MAKYKLISEDKASNGTTFTVTHEFEAEVLTEVVDYINTFLHGCGFVFDDLIIDQKDWEDVYKNAEKLLLED